MDVNNSFMSKDQLAKAFGTHLLEFIDDIRRVFPGVEDIELARKTLSKIIMIFPKLVIKLFRDHIANIYVEPIERGDIDFFINNDYKPDMQRLGYKEQDANSKIIMEKIECLRDPIRNMKGDDVQKVVKYIQNLTKLSRMYISSK